MPIYILISDESASGRRDDQQSWEQQRAVEDEDIAAQLMALKPMTEADIDEIFVKNNRTTKMVSRPLRDDGRDHTRTK
jgi:hypothetical protein